MNKLILYFVFHIIPISIWSQNIHCSGYVYDADTKEKLIGATVINHLNKTGVVTNEFGFFSIPLSKEKNNKLEVSFVGFKNQTFEIYGEKNVSNNFFLEVESLQEVLITAKKEQNIERSNEVSTIKVNISQLKKIPTIGGEADILKGIQLLPGIQQGDEGSSGLYVRGGSNDQNLFLLDDVSLYDVNHLGGFVSTFNPDALNDVKVYKAGFPARFSNRLSSVVDIRLKDGNKRKHEGNFTIGLVSSKVHFEGPIKKDTISYLVSYRRMMYDLLTRPISKWTSDFSLGYNFQDFNAKVNYQKNQKNNFSFITYLGKDVSVFATDNSKDRFLWGNNMLALKWEHRFKNQTFVNTSLSYSRFLSRTKFLNTSNNFEYQFQYDSKISDVTLKSIFEKRVSNRYKFLTGYATTYRHFLPSTIDIKQSNEHFYNSRFKTNVLEASVFFENHLDFGTRLNTNIGVNATIYQSNKNYFYDIQPRIALNYQIGEFNSIKASYSKMMQTLHFLVGENYSDLFDTDYWLPANSFANPEYSHQFSLGYVGTHPLNTYSFSAEVYYKKMNGLINYKQGSYIDETTINWENQVEKNGNGNAYGIEFFVDKKIGNTTGWVSYALGYTNRKFENINNGIKFPYKYDRRHDFKMVLFQKISDKIDFSANWVYNSGIALTLPISKFYVYLPTSEEQSVVYIYPDKNSQRLMDYHRLDVGFNFKKIKKKGVRTWNVSIYNLYNRKNPYIYDFREENDQIKFVKYTLFPIMPSFSYSYKW